ncbi:MAG: hypothetical protein ACRDJE_11390 [Dehalococcoidia bacterium]
MTTRAPRRLIVIHSLDEIPPDMTEEEEHQFWSTHTPSEALVAQAEPLPADVVALLDRIRENRARRGAAGRSETDAETSSKRASSTRRR